MIRLASAKSFCRDDYTKIENYKEVVNDKTRRKISEAAKRRWATKRLKNTLQDTM